MVDARKKFQDLLKQITEMFSIDGPLVSNKKDFDLEASSGLIFDFVKAVSDLSDVEKISLLHGIVVYLTMLAYEFNSKSKGNVMPTACVFADKMIYDLEDTCYRLFGMSLERTLIRVLAMPTVYSSNTEEKSEDVKTFEILMTADAFNRREGD